MIGLLSDPHLKYISYAASKINTRMIYFWWIVKGVERSAIVCLEGLAKFMRNLNKTNRPKKRGSNHWPLRSAIRRLQCSVDCVCPYFRMLQLRKRLTKLNYILCGCDAVYTSGTQPLSDRGPVISFFYKKRVRYRAAALQLRNTDVSWIYQILWHARFHDMTL